MIYIYFYSNTFMLWNICFISQLNWIYLMKLKSWSTDMCTNKIKYYSEVNEGYYCSHWALYLLNENDFEKIGNSKYANQVLDIWSSLLDKVNNYVSKKKLALSWRLAMDHYKVLCAELKYLHEELKDVLENGRLKDIANIQKRTLTLKSKLKIIKRKNNENV